mmetsp:Transcript_8600/g.18563  ORF Transcript_8600/g.18563 Transcript_8600/m.18563 type:complete len:116 (-) Transcript_8600:1807-2154(-)
MESPQTILMNSTRTTIDEMDQLIPKELQMPVGIAIGVLAIIFVLGLTKFSSGKKEMNAAKVQFDASATVAFATPVKSKLQSATVTESGTPINQKTGTVFTPAGRRSARLARRKED